MSIPKKATLVVALSTVVAVAAIAGLAQGETTPSPAPSDNAPPAYTQAEAMFGALRGPVVTLPRGVAQQIPTEGRFAADAGQAHAIVAPAGDNRSKQWYVIPGSDSTCFATEEGDVSCATLEEAQKGRFWFFVPRIPANGAPEVSASKQATSEIPGPFDTGMIVRGLAPDGVVKAVVTRNGKETGSAPVTNNAYYLDLPDGGDTLHLERADGTAIVLDEAAAIEPANR